nr:hypothetical protein [Tanacetum cinerariifolium]
MWDPIPDLEHTRESACIGGVIDGAVHVVNTVLNEVQVLENFKNKWQRSHSLKHELITVVNGSLYGMNYYHGDVYKLECGIWKVVASASELNNRMGYAMMGFRDDIYVIGGLVGPGGGRRGIKKISDVDVLLLGNENEKPVWKKLASMTRCQGIIRSTGYLYPVTTPSPIPHSFFVSQHTWHQHLRNPGGEVLRRRVSSNSISYNKKKPLVLCHACQLGKHVRLPFVSSDTVISSCFDVFGF